MKHRINTEKKVIGLPIDFRIRLAVQWVHSDRSERKMARPHPCFFSVSSVANESFRPNIVPNRLSHSG